MKKLINNFENTLGNNKMLIFLSTFNISKGMMNSRLQIGTFDIMNGKLSVSCNGSSVCRLFYKGRYFTCDAMWDVFKYAAPYFSISRVKNAEKKVTPAHLAVLRQAIVNARIKSSIIDAVSICNLASKDFPKFAAECIREKKVYPKRIADVPTRNAVLKALTEMMPVLNEVCIDKEVTPVTEITDSEKKKSIFSTVMTNAHKKRKLRDKTDKTFASMPFRKKMSICLKEAWADYNETSESDSTKEAAVTVIAPVEETSVPAVDQSKDTDAEDEYVIEIMRDEDIKKDSILKVCNTKNCRKNDDCLYLETYDFGYALEDRYGHLIKKAACNKGLRNNNLYLTDIRTFKPIFNKLFGEQIKTVKNNLHESVVIPKIKFEGKIYTLIILSHVRFGKFSSDIACNVAMAKEDK